MRSLQPVLSLFLVSSVTPLALVGVGACTAKVAPSYPADAKVVPATFSTLSVAQLPVSCSPGTFFLASTSLCTASLTHFLCDGSGYTEYDCHDPGSGWTQETLAEDRVATDPTSCKGSGSPSGMVYIEGNRAAPAQSVLFAYRYCNGAMLSSPVATYSMGGSGAADLNDRGVLDADQQVISNADHTLLFAVNQGSDTIAVFHIEASGKLTSVAGSPFPSGGIAPASVGISGNVLVVANKAFDGLRSLDTKEANYTTFLVQADGSLQHTTSTATLPPLSRPTQVYVAPGGKLVFTTEEAGTLRGYELASDGTLTLAKGSPIGLPDSLFHYFGRPDPVWPAGLSSSPAANVLYTGVPNNGSVAALDFTATGEVSYVADGERDPRSTLPCWSTVNAAGTRLYFANAGSGNITVWDIEKDPRHPQVFQTYLLPGGGNPWGLHLDPTGTILFVLTPRQIYQVPENQGQLVHGLLVADDGSITDEAPGSPVPIPVPQQTNPFGLAIVPAP